MNAQHNSSVVRSALVRLIHIEISPEGRECSDRVPFFYGRDFPCRIFGIREIPSCQSHSGYFCGADVLRREGSALGFNILNFANIELDLEYWIDSLLSRPYLISAETVYPCSGL